MCKADISNFESEEEMMLKLMEIQMKSGECTGSEVRFDRRLRCRVSSLLAELKKLYRTPEAQKKVFDVFSCRLSKKMPNADGDGPQAVPSQESELRVSVLKDQYGVILAHHFTP